MANDKLKSPYGDDTVFDTDDEETRLGGPGYDPVGLQARHTTIDRMPPPSGDTPAPPGSYPDNPNSEHHYIEGSLDAALVFLSDDEILDSSSVNLRIKTPPPDVHSSSFINPPTRLSPSDFEADGSLKPDPRSSGVHSSGVQQSGIRGSGVHQHPRSGVRNPQSGAHSGVRNPQSGAHSGVRNPQSGAHSGVRNPQSGAHSGVRNPQSGAHSGVRGSQVRPVSDQKSGPVPIRVERSKSRPASLPSWNSGTNSLEAVNNDDADPELQPGARLGNYEIVQKIGQGGMGVVYEARHLLLPRRVAIKFLLINKSHDEEQIRRFLGEAVASAQIGHRGVVDIYDYGYDDRNLAYLVMEFIDGQSLQAVMKRSGQLPVPMVIRIVHDVAEILAAAHKSGIVHRDLKPDNILLSRDEFGNDFTKILDFGVAKFVNAQSMSGKTKIGSILGTPWYMPPEQCQGFLTVDYRSDIYALGCVFYQMVAGKVPFAGTLRDVLMAHIHVDPQPPRNFCPSIPPAVEKLILQMMAKEPADRPVSMDVVAATLADFLEVPPARSRSSRTVPPPQPGQTQNRWLAPFLAALLAGLATSAAFYFLQG
jgi:predicted Ser/Thr protein kinase